MKTKKRLLSSVLSILSAAALSAFSLSSLTAFAADPEYSIKVTGAQEGEYYNAYRLFDLTYTTKTDSTNNKTEYSYSYTLNSTWSSFFKTGAGKDYVTLDGDTVIEIKDINKDGKTTDDAFNLAQLIMSQTTFPDSTFEQKEGADVKSDGTSATLTFDAPGYYLVVSSVGNIAILDTTPTDPNPSWSEKNIEPTLTKELADSDDKNVGLGDVIGYNVKITAQPGAKKYVFEDKLPSTLTLDTSSIKVKIGTSDLDGSNYALSTTATDDYTFQIVFKDTYLNTIIQATDITITYSATVNTTAIGDKSEITNNAVLKYGEHSTVTETAESNTSQFILLKYKNGDTAKAPLAGATFQLYDGGNDPVNLVKIDNTTYRLATSSDNTTTIITDIKTVSADAITICGLDADKTFTLEETAAPDGYNKLTERSNVTLGSEVEIANNAGTELPETGGTGTVILFTVGGILFVGLGVILVTKKRLYNEG